MFCIYNIFGLFHEFDVVNISIVTLTLMVGNPFMIHSDSFYNVGLFVVKISYLWMPNDTFSLVSEGFSIWYSDLKSNFYYYFGCGNVNSSIRAGGYLCIKCFCVVMPTLKIKEYLLVIFMKTSYGWKQVIASQLSL